MKRERKYFVAKHDLQSFKAWPGVIWRTGESEFPLGLKKMQVGDRWIGFAYINDENQRAKTQQVVGFYECTSIPTKRVEIPPKPRSLAGQCKLAWAIMSKDFGRQPSFPVTIPPVNDLLDKPAFMQQTLTPISKTEFNHILQTVKDLKLDPKQIPLLNRDPQNEMEVVGILLASHKDLGIEKIDRIRTKFPDLRVKLEGKREMVHLEIEVYSSNFVSHGHHKQVYGRKLRTDDSSEKLPVAVVCWNDDDKYPGGKVRKLVHNVYELQNLLQRKAKIQWGR